VALTDKQKGVIRGVIPAVILTIVALVGGSLVLPFSVLPIDEPGARLAWTLQWALLPMLALIVSVARVGNQRFYSAEDIDGSGLTEGTRQVRILRAVLQNTLEQAALAVAAYLIWAASMPLRWLGAIPAAALLFVTGRVLFSLGYDRGAPGRATGFALTMYPTAAMLATAAVVLLWRILAWIGVG
jgi:MAPEG family